MQNLQSFILSTRTKTHSKLLQSLRYQKKVHEFCNSHTSLKDLISNLFELPYFNSFFSFILVFHEKGDSTCEFYLKKIDSELQKGTLQPQEFVKLFNIVKKSKNKNFTTFKDSSFDFFGIMGSFLAREITLKNFNCFFILTRNDFLTPRKDEIFAFTGLTNWLPQIIESYLENDRINTRSKALQSFFYFYPQGIRFFKNKNLIYRNISQESNDVSSISHQPDEHLEIHNINNCFFDQFHNQRIKLLGDLLNTLQHELSNPLFGLSLSLDYLMTQADPDELEAFHDLSDNVKRSQEILQNFTEIFGQNEELINFDITEIIRKSITLIKSESKGVAQIVFNEKNSYWTLIHPTWLVQILFNLFLNSIQAFILSGKGNKINITIEGSSQSNSLYIKIHDNGPGISLDLQNKIFDPFFTSKKKGTGLGLSLSRELAHKLSGNLTLDHSSTSSGTTFCLELPRKNNFECFNN